MRFGRLSDPCLEGRLSSRNLISGFKKYKIEYCLLDITSDIDVPNVLCVVWTYDGEGNRRITLGASTNFNPLAAIESAILEAIATLCTRHNDMDFSMDDFKNYIPFTDTNIEKEARVKFYFNKNVSKYIDFLIANKISSGIEKSSSHKEVSISVEDWAAKFKAIYENNLKDKMKFSFHLEFSDISPYRTYWENK